MRVSLGLSSVLLLPVLAAAAPPPPKNFYHPGDLIGVTCLNRTIDNGEHVADSNGHLQYIPFPPPPLSCSDERGSPATLRLPFLSESLLNCTIPALTDELYHLLEFYVHADSPLSCRIPRRPPGGERDLLPSSSSSGGEEWIPLVISLSGKFERSHLHISNHINLIVHISPDELDTTNSASNPGMVIDSAAAYSVSPLSPSAQTKIIPGDPLPLLFTLRCRLAPPLPKRRGADTDMGTRDGGVRGWTCHDSYGGLLSAELSRYGGRVYGVFPRVGVSKKVEEVWV
ncbi:hypothetical protein L211DRAFT_866938 [Terfezia boudieri ATCC MYA-4762]|uniref:Ubiquitin 3 binding protein But2 C-terminal domain-containing protein n=1 Tax=Terfezia boudieri ATCC MYA-4762 TaxID=1051890 RepID=A0A3N4LZB5_9PEZI|nr:hypothetical protein L211DRAFT_866938 [Terfezia boudieri ATCC MYA-4762]